MSKNKNGIYVKADRLMCDSCAFEGSAESVKAYIDSIVEKAKENGMYGDGRFEFSARRDFYDDYEINVYYEFERVETEKEKLKRENAELKRKESVAAKRKAKELVEIKKKTLKADAEYDEFLRLKEKFKELEL